MSLDLSESILIKAAKRKTGSLTIESQPGTDAVNVTDYVTDPAKLLYISDYIGGDWTLVSAAELNEWQEIAYGNGVFVAVAQTGTNRIMRSTDYGVTWNAIAAPAATSWWSIAYGNGVFIALCWDGASTQRVIRSTDYGVTWNFVGTLSGTPRDVTYGNGVFVIVCGSDPYSLYSIDYGATWTELINTPTQTWEAVAYGNGVFVAVSSDGTNRAMRSTDYGVTWTSIATPGSHYWREITYGNGVFIAVAQSGPNYAMRSTDDGLTWSEVSVLTSTTSITYADGVFIGFGSAYINTSFDDGLTWHSSSTPEICTWSSVAYGNNRFVAVAQSGTYRSAYSLSNFLQAALDDIDGSTKTAIDIDVASLTFTQTANLTLSANTIIQGYPFTLSGYGFATLTSYNLTLQNCVHPFAITGNKTIVLDHCKIYLSTGKPVNVTGQTIITGCDIYSADDNGITITNNIFTIEDTKVKATASGKYALNLTGTAASLANIDIEQNTIIGNMYLTNTGSTGLEQMRDNINYGNVTSTVDFEIESGNIYGTATGMTVNSRVLNVNPLFEDTTDYKLQREIDGYNFDSPLCRASFYHYTTQGVRRDIGAWNMDDSAVVDNYSVAYLIPKPSYISEPQNGTIQAGVTFTARQEIGQSGAVDVYNNPEKRIDFIVINYASLHVEYWERLKYIMSKKNLECMISLKPETFDTDSVIVTANGGNAVDEPLIDITTTYEIPIGAIIKVGELYYNVMYPIPLSGVTTSLVLDRVLEVAVSDTQNITVYYPESVGVYKLLPQDLQYEVLGDNFIRGLTMKFIRKSL